MAMLKSKKSKEKPDNEKKVSKTTPAEVQEAVSAPEEAVSPYLNSDEQEALAIQHEKDTESEKKVSTEKLQKAVEVAESSFNLSGGNFAVTGFSDKGNKFTLSLSSEDFDLTVTIKDAEKYGIF